LPLFEPDVQLQGGQSSWSASAPGSRDRGGSRPDGSTAGHQGGQRGAHRAARRNSEAFTRAVAPTVIMLVGLQGSGKTTTAVKLALLSRRDGPSRSSRPWTSGVPAAVEQLRRLPAARGLHSTRARRCRNDRPRRAGRRRDAWWCDVRDPDTAGRLRLTTSDE